MSELSKLLIEKALLTKQLEDYKAKYHVKHGQYIYELETLIGRIDAKIHSLK